MSYPADPYWSYVKHLLHFDGVNGSAKMVDERHSSWVVYAGARLSSLITKFGNTSLNLVSTTGAVEINTSVGWGAGVDGCMEIWAYPTDTTNATPCVITHGGPSSFSLQIDPAAYPNKAVVWLSTYSASVPMLISTSNIAFGQWTHFAVVKAGTTWTLYVNGIAEASVTTFAVLSNSSYLSIGGYYSGGTGQTGFLGYLADFRHTQGAARYTANFAPPTAALPHNGAVDNYYDKVTFLTSFSGESGTSNYVDSKGHVIRPTLGANALTSVTDFKFGGSSLGPTSGLTCETDYSTDFNIGVGDFTLEFWAKPTTPVDSADGHKIIQIKEQGYSVRALEVSYTGSQTYPRLMLPSVTTTTDTVSGVSSAVSAYNAWKFMSVTRVGDTVYLHQDGVLVVTSVLGTQGSLNSAAYQIKLGGQSLTAYLDEVRFTKGFARYSGANYTPPSEPFPQVGLQKLSGAVLDASNNPISRKVRAFRRSDALLTDTVMSDPTTGAFELRATDTSEHYVMVFDDAKNALVYDHIVPVV